VTRDHVASRARASAVCLLAAAGLLGACDPGSSEVDGGAGSDSGACAPVTVAVPGEAVVDVTGCGATLALDAPRVLELWTEGAALEIDGGPRRFDAGSHDVPVSGAATLHVRDLGPPPGEVAIDRSLAWTDAALLDDPSVVGLDRLMRTLSGEAHPGRLLDAFFRRFGTTAHSERLGPQRLLEDQIASQGADPTAWDLDAFPFRVTGVHNRIDLADGAHCGELRVSLASTHPLHQPFHLIFLYRQAPSEADVSPDGTAHCAATALRWARLSDATEDDFRDSARAILDEALVAEGFLVLETVEFIISPWEWRQWFLEPGPTLENRPLFQTVDTERLNRPGSDRDDFLAWVSDNAEDIDARRILIPERFRAASARVNDGVPWIPLDLGGLAALDAYPDLRRQLEIVGCPACHATDADFVQTLPDRTFSPFYARELDARVAHLLDRGVGVYALAPHGPLQRDPALPP